MPLNRQSKEDQRKKMFLGLETACAASADAIFAAVAEEKGRMKQEIRADTPVVVAGEEMRNRVTQVRAVAAVVSRENSEEIQEKADEPSSSPRSPSNRKRKLIVKDNNAETKMTRTTQALPCDESTQVEEAHSVETL
jgi:vacuolar-type H+-ATPase subunit H